MVLVYPLGFGSVWQNNEIKYSIRSAVKHFDVTGVVVVGAKVVWLDADYILHRDANRPKMFNTTLKLQAAVNSDLVPERFVWMNDDFFFMRDMKQIPCLHKGTMQESLDTHPTKSGLYWNTTESTLRFIQRNLGVGEPLDYSIHCPMVLEKQKVLETLELIGGPKSILFRAVYGNHHRLGGAKHEDMKLRVYGDMPKDDWPFFSTSDTITRARKFTAWLEAQYPSRSRYEKGR